MDEDGTVNKNYDYIRKLNFAFDQIDISSAKSHPAVAFGLYKPYQWFNQITSAGEFDYINVLTDQTFGRLTTDISGISYDYEIYDLESSDTLLRSAEFQNIKVLFVPCADFMSDELQKKLLDIVSAGMTVVFVGLLPKYNMQFKPSKTLAKGLGLAVKESYSPARITVDNYSFSSLAYGCISGMGSAKAVAKSGLKVMGVTKKLGKGKFYYFTYDISAGGEPGKLSFLKELLRENEAVTPISCSDPDVRAIVQSNDKGVLIYLLNAGIRQANDIATRKIVVAVDLARVGLRQAKVTLHDVMEPETTIKTTSQDLKEGLIFTMGYLDSKLYYIPKK